MHFLPDVYVPCEQCHGKRYNRETLEVRFKGKTIADVLEMPIEEALEFFAHIPKISRRVQALFDVGLGYMRLGQPATTLSGGEAQRVKLAAELSKVATGTTMYILDEPTTGLHFADIQRLLEVLDRLVQTGNSVVVIEHNLDVIKVSDRLIDLGPEGGDEGGQVIATGTPEQVAQVAASHTAHFLAEILPVKVTRATRQNGSNGNGSGKTTAKGAPAKRGSVEAGSRKPAASNGAAKPAVRSKARAR
jgi:excinuclease ABC subunit A